MLPTNWGFCDLCVSNKFNFSNLKYIEKLGFTTIAIDTFVEEPNDEPKKKKKKGEVKEKQDFPPPMEVNAEGSKLNILHRLTLEISDHNATAHKIIQSNNIKKYDIIAVMAKTFAAFQYAVSSMDIDIIAFPPETKLAFKIPRKLYTLAIDRGIFFELPYAPMIKDSMFRKNVISLAHTFHTVGKSKNVIVTSNADNQNYIRGVYDVVNLGFLLGLNESESLEAVRNNGRRLILKAQGRRNRKLHVTIVENEEILSS